MTDTAPATGALIDPHGGQADLRARVLRHTSAAFVEDPLRVLRGMQFAARFELREEIAQITVLHQRTAGAPARSGARNRNSATMPPKTAAP